VARGWGPGKLNKTRDVSPKTQLTIKRNRASFRDPTAGPPPTEATPGPDRATG